MEVCVKSASCYCEVFQGVAALEVSCLWCSNNLRHSCWTQELVGRCRTAHAEANAPQDPNRGPCLGKVRGMILCAV